MRRIGSFLFSTSPRFGLTVGCLGVVLAFVDTIQGPEPPYLIEIGIVMILGGLPYALLTAYLRPERTGGLGITFSVLYIIVDGATRYTDIFIIEFWWSIVVWMMVCLGILVAWLTYLYRNARNDANRYSTLLQEERIRAGRDPITGELSPSPFTRR